MHKLDPISGHAYIYNHHRDVMSAVMTNAKVHLTEIQKYTKEI